MASALSAVPPGHSLGGSFKESDRSTWSMEALRKLGMVELVDLQCYAGANFRSVLSMYINVQVLDRTSTNNMPGALGAPAGPALPTPCPQSILLQFFGGGSLSP